MIAQGIDPALRFDSAARIPEEAIDALIAEAASQSGDPAFALREADFLRPGHLGALGFAWLASRTLRAAIERLQRFQSMVNDNLHVVLEEQDDLTTIGLDSSIDAVAPHLTFGGGASIMLTLCRWLHGTDLTPRHVTIKAPSPGSGQLAPYYARFQCKVDFDQALTTLSFPRELLDQRLTGADEQLAQLSDHIAVKYLAHRGKNDVINQVKTHIIEGLGTGEASEDFVARQLHTSTRHLHRRLLKAETSFKTLLNETRQELADQYIADHTLTLTEIAFLLGFSEASSFSRAYKRWSGQSPSAARSTTA